MTSKRKYESDGGAARALDAVGERWALLVVRELLPGPRRFTELRRGLPGISANVLTQRLTELEAAGVLRRLRLPPPAAAWMYELTDHGRALDGLLLALERWGGCTPAAGPDAMMLTLRARFRPPAQAGQAELVLDGQAYQLRWDAQGLQARRGPLPAARLSLRGSRADLLAALDGEAGALQIDGDAHAARTLLDCLAGT
ncbi:winged helix-turn-helix transcriptional regulator [Bordetella hinzii]|uniref:Transcriptional regulator, HxlR family n=1 Tax=Bordetella hinzii OH87 BAL007II TaxID=1331262 RepID=A0ABR4QWT0_9BORD|nr:helix-turn-helix domain-containing protein [Bordetella hinzii]KCB22169.1 transcriptional regulator, HxlR family [Bordetella hinzii OH87 BAL007II]KCB39997.1 transcriptional regulator, HxlR family [Bordetella hinzii 5132]QDJ42462.1 transcriptional regulator [Bordetella hinzii]QDJ47030.1 transcriptional regulator [Bordetella hinzii]QDJ55940.1 transcriptional regulator [Bordetella hinzii]